MIYTSYFYQIRNMPKTMIPVSTALWDPSWFHEGQGQDHIWTDKRGVINGFRFEFLAPDKRCNSLCRGRDSCSIKDPNNCEFLKKYREQLDEIKFDDFMEIVKAFTEVLSSKDKEVDVALIFHESPDNHCSEREVIKQWFKDNGQEIKEFNK